MQLQQIDYMFFPLQFIVSTLLCAVLSILIDPRLSQDSKQTKDLNTKNFQCSDMIIGHTGTGYHTNFKIYCGQHLFSQQSVYMFKTVTETCSNYLFFRKPCNDVYQMLNSFHAQPSCTFRYHVTRSYDVYMYIILCYCSVINSLYSVTQLSLLSSTYTRNHKSCHLIRASNDINQAIKDLPALAYDDSSSTSRDDG